MSPKALDQIRAMGSKSVGGQEVSWAGPQGQPPLGERVTAAKNGMTVSISLSLAADCC